MDAATLARPTVFFLNDGFGFEPKVYKGSNGGRIYKDVAVFRSGTFRDSMGEQNTWEDLHIKQMMDNFGYLSNKHILPSVPVRNGHQGFLVSGLQGRGDVVGWHMDVRTKVAKSPHDGNQYDYLFVDYELLAPYALGNVDSGLWRNRSSEIGTYRTNAEAELWPVYMGFAFVDIPAVEGLNFSSSQGTRCFVFMGGHSRENSMTDTATQGQGAGGGLPFPPFVPQVPSQTPPAVQSAFSFTCGGTPVTDPTQVQAYINRLETTFNEQRQAARSAFVKGLVVANKIPAPQEQAFSQHVMGLNDEQFGQLKQLWEAMPVQQLLANHGGGVSNHGNVAQVGAVVPSTAPGAGVSQDVLDAQEIVKNHERGGIMTLDEIKATGSYKKLVTAGLRQA